MDTVLIICDRSVNADRYSEKKLSMSNAFDAMTIKGYYADSSDWVEMTLHLMEWASRESLLMP